MLSLNVDVRGVTTSTFDRIALECGQQPSDLSLAILGEVPTMGAWGSNKPLLLDRVDGADTSTPPSWQLSKDLVIMHFLSNPDVLEYRIVVWNSREHLISAVDASTHLPSRAVLQTKPHHADPSAATSDDFSLDENPIEDKSCSISIDANSKWNSLHFESRVSLRYVTHKRRETSGPYLRLNIFPNSNTAVYNQKAWLHEMEKLGYPYKEEDNITGEIYFSKADVLRSTRSKWTTLGSVHKALHDSFAEDSTVEEPNPEHAVVEPLEKVSSIPGTSAGGIRGHRSMDYWTVTYDIGAMDQHAIRLHFATHVSDAAGDTQHKGSISFLPEMFQGSSSGYCVSAAVASDTGYVGPVFVSYALVTRFKHKHNNLRILRSIESNKQLFTDNFIGHRGLGKTYTNAPDKARKSKLAENSIESFQAASSRGCNMVEFDVMLTGDKIPIIMHDAILQVRARLKAGSGNFARLQGSFEQFAGASTQDMHQSPKTPYYTPVPVGVHSLPLHQLREVMTQTVMPGPRYRLRELILKHWHRIVKIHHQMYPAHKPMPRVCSLQAMSSDSNLDEVDDILSTYYSARVSPPKPSFSAAKSPSPDPITSGSMTPSPQRMRHKHLEDRGLFTKRNIENYIPTLHEMFDTLSEDIGFLLEVKFPFQPDLDSKLYLQTDHFEINSFVDSILKVVFRYADQNRQIVFCCFDPATCIALTMKQTRYHVFFLDDAEDEGDQKDYRCIGVEPGIQFCCAERMAGISLSSATLLPSKYKQLPKQSFGDPTLEDVESGSAASFSKIRYGDGQTAAQKWKSFEADGIEYGRGVSRTIQERGLALYTWGGENDDHYFDHLQISQLGVAAVITDNVPLWASKRGSLSNTPADEPSPFRSRNRATSQPSSSSASLSAQHIVMGTSPVNADNPLLMTPTSSSISPMAPGAPQFSS